MPLSAETYGLISIVLNESLNTAIPIKPGPCRQTIWRRKKSEKANLKRNLIGVTEVPPHNNLRMETEVGEIRPIDLGTMIVILDEENEEAQLSRDIEHGFLNWPRVSRRNEDKVKSYILSKGKFTYISTVCMITNY